MDFFKTLINLFTHTRNWWTKKFSDFLKIIMMMIEISVHANLLSTISSTAHISKPKYWHVPEKLLREKLYLIMGIKVHEGGPHSSVKKLPPPRGWIWEVKTIFGARDLINWTLLSKFGHEHFPLKMLFWGDINNLISDKIRNSALNSASFWGSSIAHISPKKHF